jgi:uncharacterized protein YllA (UPF0747 family)
MNLNELDRSLYEDLKDSELTAYTSEPELKEEQSISELKFLLQHFRSLAEAKDTVIRDYREMLERLKPSIAYQDELNKRISYQNIRIADLEKDISKMKEKQVKKEEKKKRV